MKIPPAAAGGIGSLLALLLIRVVPGLPTPAGYALNMLLCPVLLLAVPMLFLAAAGAPVRWDWPELRSAFRAIRPLKLLAGSLVIFGVLLLILFLQDQMFGPDEAPPEYPWMDETSAAWIAVLSAFCVTVAGPIAEEWVFRRWCYDFFRIVASEPAAMVLTSLLFALSHESWRRLLPMFVLGMCLQYAVRKKNSLLPSVLLHALNNLWVVLLTLPDS